MLISLRKRLRHSLEDGFWFPAFQSTIAWLHSRLSLGHRFKRWLAEGDSDAPDGASELYQVVLIVLAAMWVTLITVPLHPVLTTPALRIFGGVIAAYFIVELFVFSLDWTFVAEKPLESYRRSLATFVVSLIEVALLFFVVLSLADCYETLHHPLIGAYKNLTAMTSIQLVSVRGTTICGAVAHFERLLGAILMVIIIASLVGSVIRKQKGDKLVGRET